MTISMKEGLSSASSSLYHWIDLRVWILLEKTVLCFLDSSVLCCGTYPWFVQGPLVALWVFQSTRKLDLILLIHLVWRLGGCFCHPDPSLYLCGCDSYSVGKLCLVSISRNCSRYWWVRNLNHWLIRPLCCCLVAKSCPTLCDPMDCSLPGYSVHGILQARILEWVATSFSKGSFRLKDLAHISCIAGRFFTIWATIGSSVCCA